MNMKKMVILSLVLALLGVVVLVLFLPCRSGEDPAIFSVPMGVGAAKISRDLESQGFIHSAVLFRLTALLTGAKHKLKAGEYEIPGGASLWRILAILKSGKSMLHEFTVPEGFSSFQIAELLGSQKLAKPERFLDLAHSSEEAQKLSVTAQGLEGYLFPDTYQIPRGLGEERILRMMVERFRQKVGPELLAKGRAQGLTPHQVVILASVVEREAKADSERPKVASVFLNRLKKNMRLESCATVRFAMNKYQGPVLDQDLHFKSRYNTYRHRGMPPGPICSPGLTSLEAAAQPAQTDYLFFVVAGDGAHVFSKTFEEHKKAKFRHKARLRAGVVEE
jgi:UPF0755 protein